MRIFVCKLRFHFPDSKHLRGFVCHEIFGNFFRHFGLHPSPPPPPPNYACLATALAITCLISMYMTNIYVKFLLNAMVSNTIFATFWAVTITKIIAKIIVGIIVFINCSLKRCKSNIRNLSEVMHVGGGGGGHGKKTCSRKGATETFPASARGS